MATTSSLLPPQCSVCVVGTTTGSTRVIAGVGRGAGLGRRTVPSRITDITAAPPRSAHTGRAFIATSAP
ncbi:hypothetical protein ACIBQX_40980 [Nonomuraea sp. NPDC049714]|uniref:hypothetical protein n=1 Tax=Nonomuraea sp. NPDC049714 TaxID=3364357 RepID=UPI0037B89CC3